ncbi:MAG: hypothetical protein EB023_03315 [Flavobacteriia bacterium]|nr:hypothetical protein [Flavobacteriia bacterium]
MRKNIKFLYFSIILLFISCTSGIQKPIEKKESGERVSTEHKGVKPKEFKKPYPDKSQKISGETKNQRLKDIRTYYHITYKHLVGYDTVTDHLQICKNMFTFFIDNPNYKQLEQFRAAGFPMEFWSTDMCSFFGVPETKVNLFLNKAARLGYTTVGYNAQLMNEQDTSSLIISNHLEIYLNRSAAHEDIHQVMNDIDGIILEGASLDYAFVIKVESNRIKEIIRAFKKLQQHPLVRHIEFIPESCYPRI